MPLENFDFSLRVPQDMVDTAKFVGELNILVNLLVVSQQLSEIIALQSGKPVEEVKKFYSGVFRDYIQNFPLKFAAKFGESKGQSSVS